MFQRLFLLLILAACSKQEPGPKGSADGRPPARDEWWKQATAMPSGAERILAPRELRELLEAGKVYGFDTDRSWWTERTNYVYDRILEMDPDDEQANAAKGFKTLQSLPGFLRTWERMLMARVTSKDIDGLIADYDHKVQDGEPVFLNEEGFAVETARLRRAKQHLDRLKSDPAYEALQVAIARVKATSLNDYPFVHIAVGPFLVFYCARDLQRIEDADAAAEEQRIGERRAVYTQKLEKMSGMYKALVKDVASLYPGLWKQHAPRRREIHYQWIFGDRGWYQDYLDRIRKTNPESTYRTGFLDKATGWCFLYEPLETKAQPDAEPPPAPEKIVLETAAFLAAKQLMYRWGRDKLGVGNRLDRSRAYWVKEGWPAFLAARRIKKPLVGRLLVEGKRFNRIFPPMSRVVERESRLELRRYDEPAHEFGEDEDDERVQLFVQLAFTDLAWRLVEHFNDDKRRGAFERYLLAQIAGQKKLTFEECFGVESETDWKRLTRAVYRGIKDK